MRDNPSVPTITTAGLVLAAGAGSRFGVDSKLLAELDGRPLLEHAVAAQCAVGALDRVVVVLGSRADEIRRHVDFGRAEIVVCEQWQAGQSASLRCGASALRGADKVIVTLGDMPRIGPDLITRFLGEPRALARVMADDPDIRSYSAPRSSRVCTS